MCFRVGLLERMPILEKTANNTGLSNGDSRATADEDELMSSVVNNGRLNSQPMHQVTEVKCIPFVFSPPASETRISFFAVSFY